MKAWLVTDGETYELVRAETRGRAIYDSDLYRDLYYTEPGGWMVMRARRVPEFDGDFPFAHEHYLRARIAVTCGGCRWEVTPSDYEDGAAVLVDGQAYHRECLPAAAPAGGGAR